MPEERNKKISIQLASQCAPTFLRVKPSSLMMLCPEDTEVLEVQTRKAGVSRCLLYRGNQRDMWLLYREEELNEILKKEEVRRFFQAMGYTSFSLPAVLNNVRVRLLEHRENEGEYPHELGILLGYPLEDVQGFIRNKGKNYLYSGYWKVYGDVEKAIQLFQSYDRARKQMLAVLLKEQNVRRISA